MDNFKGPKNACQKIRANFTSGQRDLLRSFPKSMN